MWTTDNIKVSSQPKFSYKHGKLPVVYFDVLFLSFNSLREQTKQMLLT